MANLEFKNLNPLRNGKFLGSHFNNYNNVFYFDILIDNRYDMDQRNVIISSYYYSQDTQKLKVFMEESSIMKKAGVKFDTVKRLGTNNFYFTIFEAELDDEFRTPCLFLLVKNRFFGSESK